MKILAFAATNNTQSINQQLLQSSIAHLKSQQAQPDDIDVQVLDLNDFEMPIYSQQREEASGIPDQAKAFYQAISDADAVLIAFAEHNASYTAAYKNVFDWASRIDMKVYQQKSVVMLATSPGPGGAKNVLNTAVTSAPYFGADVEASWSLPSFYQNFDSENQVVIDNDERQALHDALAALMTAAEARVSVVA